MKVKHILTFAFLTLVVGSVAAQQAIPATNTKEYHDLKVAGKIPQAFIGTPGGPNMLEKMQPVLHPSNTVQATTQCNCIQTLDNTFNIVPFTNGDPADGYRNDDGSTSEIQLPFSFCLYGNTYNSVYINNNGNVSFGSAYSTFSSSSFPTSSFSMVAPFWGDVDTQGSGSGLVYYKITNTAMIVRWQNVGYFSSQYDKVNDFQLIITNGADPIIPIGSNVAFCYNDMQWTTGSASSGVNGFGGIPATVGANSGDGTNYIQFGRFDVAGSTYDGPFGNNDGVSWLDNQNFYFNVCTNNNNIAPIVSGISVCDTLTLCVGESLPLNFSFLSPEQAQTTSITINSNGVTGFTGTSTSGNTGTVTANFNALLSNQGFNTITFTGTDDGSPSASTTVTVVVHVIDVVQPIITGAGFFCAGQSDTLIVNGGFDTYTWTPDSTLNDTLIVSAPGTYTINVSIQGCALDTSFTVAEGNPVANIAGNQQFCDGECITLNGGGVGPFYTWFVNGVLTDSTQTISVCDTSNVILIISDQYGCLDSDTASVISSPAPVAAFATNPPNPGFIGQPVQITDQSTSPNGGTITAWDWTIPNGVPSSSTIQNPVVLYSDISDSTITLIVTNSFGCTDTLTIPFEAIPAYIPNVFTPNGDGQNETFVIPKAAVIPNCKLFVYSRWGRLVYQSDNYKNDWDGEGHTDAVYYYVFVEPSGEDENGTVTILRNGK